MSSGDRDAGPAPSAHDPEAENNPAAANTGVRPRDGHTEEEVAVTSQAGALAVMQLIASGELFAGTSFTAQDWPSILLGCTMSLRNVSKLLGTLGPLKSDYTCV